MNHIYVNRKHISAEDPGACFINQAAGICRQIVDPHGYIRNFPGVETCRDLERERGSKPLEPVVRHGMAFSEPNDGKILVLWTIRAEYFDPGDDWGFGREEIDEIKLYSHLNENGDFTHPFRLYSIGKRLFSLS